MPRQRKNLPRARRVAFESLEARQLLATLWRNPVDAIDVNNDGQIGAFDAIEIINQLNSVGTHGLPLVKPAGEPFLDPTGDNGLTAFDALAVINHLNSRPAGAYVLQEQAGQIVDQQSITITAGTLPAGARTYRLLVQPQFDVTDTQSAMEDLFAVYLFNPVTGQTVIDAGSSGSSLFTLRGTQGTTHNGLVHWDGTHLSIDLSQVAAETLELRLQLLNPDADSGSKVTITPVSNLVDPLGVPGAPGTLRSPPTLPAAAAANVASYLQMPTLRVELENPIYNQTTGRFTAEVRLANDTDATITNGIVRLPDVSAAIVVNASGVIGTIPYWNFASVIGSAGIAPGAKSGWLKIELNLNGQSFLWRPDARGYTSTEHLAQIGVFSTNFSDYQERQIYHMPLLAHEGVLTLRMQSPGSHTVQLLEPSGSPVAGYVNDYINQRIKTYYPPVSGDYQFEVISSLPGDFAVAFQKVANLPELTIGSEISGYIDPRLGPKVFRFYGAAGQRLVFENREPVDGTNYAKWQVIAPFDAALNPLVEQYPNGNLEVEVRFDGWHYLVLSAPSYNNNVFRPYDYIVRSPIVTEEPLTFGVAHAGSFDHFNEARVYTFTGVPGQQIVMDLLTETTPYPYIGSYLLNPNGVQLPFNVLNGPVPLNPHQPFVIDMAGTWKVVMQGNESESFTFRILNVADLNELGPGTNSTADVNQTRSDYFRIPAVLGERLTLASSSHSSVLTQMFSPAGVPLPQIESHQFLVTETGEQLLRIYTLENGTFPYDFTLQQNLEAPVTQSGLDVDYTGTLTPGTTTIGTFSASAGAQLMFDQFALVNAAATHSVRITGPDFDQVFDKDSDVITLARSGDYAISATNTRSTNVAYGFRVIDLAAAPWLSHGERMDLSFTTLGKTFVWRVEGKASEKLLLNRLGDSLLDEVTIKLKTDAGVGVNSFAHPHVEDYEFVATKTHYLTVEQRYAEVPEFGIQAALTAEAELLPLDTPFSGTLGPNGGFQLYKLEAQERDVLIINALSMTSTLSAGILNGRQEALDLSEPKRFHILENGTNYLWLRPWGGPGQSSYTLQIGFESDAVTPIALNTIVNGTLSVGESRNYELDVPAGSRLLFDGLSFTNPAHVAIFDEHGFSVGFDLDTQTDRMIDAEAGGKYKISVSSSTLPFSFRVVDVQDAPLLPLNTNLQGTIAADGQARIWRFPAKQYQQIFVDSNATILNPFGGSLSIYTPSGYAIGSTSATTNNDLSVMAQSNGDHYLVIGAGSLPFNYDLQVGTSETTVIPITLGTTVSGVLRDPGDVVEYVFQGTRGQHVHVEGITNNAYFRLLNSGSFSSTNEGLSYLLPATGEYRVQVFANSGQANATYRLQIADVATLPVLPLDTLISGSTTQGDWLMYRVPAAIGDRIAFDSQQFSGPTANNSWQLISPGANSVFYPVPTFVNGDRTLTLSDDGDYVLIVRLPSGAIDYAFQVNAITQPAVTLAGLNQTYSGTVVNTNVVNIPFTARAGQRVLVDVLDNVNLPAARLLGPDGSVVVFGDNDAWATNDRLFVLPVSGTYQVEVSSASATPRNFRFRLIDVSALPVTPHDTPFAVNFSLPYQGGIWAFDATVGDQLAIDLGLAQQAASFRIIQPDGKGFDQNLGVTAKILQMKQTGRHYLVMDGQGITPFAEIGHIWNTHNLPLITSEDPIDVHFTNREWHLYSFDLALGDRVYFAPLTTPPALLQFSFTGPDGLTESVSLVTANPNAFTVTPAGRYTLILTHPSTTPVDFTFQIHKIPLREIFGVARE